MAVVWVEKDNLLPAVIDRLEEVEVVLDIGCGIMPQKYVRPLVHVCFEPFEQYVELLQEKTRRECDRTYVIMKGNWADAVRHFPPKSVDTVFLIDVIEHLEKEEAFELLKATENLVRRQIVIFTPLGFMPQCHQDGKDAWGLDGGEWQQHRSGWYPEDFHDSWDFFAASDFHSTDNLGRQLEKPYGALWAIKTFTQETEINKSSVFDIVSTVFANAHNFNKSSISKIICLLFKHAQSAESALLGHVIQKIMIYSSSIDLKIYTAVLDVYVRIKYSKPVVGAVNKFRKVFTNGE